MRWFMLLLCLLTLAAPALAREEIVPVPPDFVLDKQLPGEDAWWLEKATFSHNGKLVAAWSGQAKLVKVWDVASGQLLKDIPAEVHHYDAVDGLEFSLDDSQLLMIRNFQPMRYLDWKNAKVVREIPLNADPKKIMDYAFSPDMNMLAVGTSTGIHLWDLKAGSKWKTFVSEVPVCSVDWLEYTPPKSKKVRLLGYCKPLLPPNQDWKKVGGIINIDSGAVTPILDDVPEKIKVNGKMTFFRMRFEWAGDWLTVCCWTIPPQGDVKAHLILVNAHDGKYSSHLDLGQLTVSFDPRYLGRPFWGFEVSTADMTGSPYKTAAQFIVPTREGLKILDTVTEQTLPVQSIVINRAQSLAAVCLKKDPADTSKLFLYKLVPKKK